MLCDWSQQETQQNWSKEVTKNKRQWTIYIFKQNRKKFKKKLFESSIIVKAIAHVEYLLCAYRIPFTASDTATDNPVCDSRVPSHMPAVAGTQPICHIAGLPCDYNTCGPADIHKRALIMAISWTFKHTSPLDTIEMSLSNFSLIKKPPADSGDRRPPGSLPWKSTQVAELVQGLNTRHLPPETWAILGQWPWIKRLSEIHFAPRL